MALFGIGASPVASPCIRGDGLYLRVPEIRDFEQWATLRDRSRAFLSPWEPVWAEDDLTRASFRRRVRRHVQEMESEEAFAFLIFRETDDCLLGGVTLGHLRRGVSQTATMGYWMGAQHAGKRHMSRAVRALTGYAFGTLRLHRLEAACLPHNTASIRLLEATGFKHEGLARGYLRIAGQWQDHLLYALLDGDPPGLSLRRV